MMFWSKLLKNWLNQKPSVDASTQPADEPIDLTIETDEPSTSAKTDEQDLHALKVDAETAGANLLLLTPSGEYFYLYWVVLHWLVLLSGWEIE